MPYIEWKDEYNVRIPQIDAQHNRLVGLLNELYEAMKAGKGKEVLETILSDLANYVRVHFTTEEQLLNANGYPDYQAHCQEHARFVQQVREFQNQVSQNRMTISVQVSVFLKDWLINHILKTDQQYSDFLIGRGVR